VYMHLKIFKTSVSILHLSGCCFLAKIAGRN